MPLRLVVAVGVNRIKGVYAANATNQGFRQITVEKKVQKRVEGMIDDVGCRHVSLGEKADSCLRPRDFSELEKYFEGISAQHG